jgi:AraC family transcriptional regulator
MMIAPAEILDFPGIRLAALEQTMSFRNNLTPELWTRFSMICRRFPDCFSGVRYSVASYPPDFFSAFHQDRAFNKWAAAALTINVMPTAELSWLEIPAGRYAVFEYHGPAADAAPFFKVIFNEWLPQSGYRLDSRPHFERMILRQGNTFTFRSGAAEKLRIFGHKAVCIRRDNGLKTGRRGLKPVLLRVQPGISLPPDVDRSGRQVEIEHVDLGARSDGQLQAPYGQRIRQRRERDVGFQRAIQLCTIPVRPGHALALEVVVDRAPVKASRDPYRSRFPARR